MNVLIACEFSGTVRDAFIEAGHDAISCDLLPTETPGPHYQGNVLDILGNNWDLMIAHPPCTYMCNSSAKHLYIGKRKENGIDKDRWRNMVEAAEFFKLLWNAPIPRICMENPVMLPYAKAIIGVRQDQIIQPWMFGHPESKQTCLWLKGLPALKPTNIVPGPYEQRVHRESPGPDRWKHRSRTYSGIAKAIAAQWSF